MLLTNLYISLVVGVALSLIFCEILGVAPGALIVPGYLALFFDQPIFIIVILAISMLTYLLVMHGVSKITVLYGRRKFVAMLVTAIILKLSLDLLYPVVPYQIFELRGIGVIVPALIANNMQKQGWTYTLGSTVVVTAITYSIISLAL